MTWVSLAFLLVCLFGAFAYGSATSMALRQATPVWGGPALRRDAARQPFDRVSLVMFVACTLWFALNAAAAFGELVAGPLRWVGLNIGVFALAFLFPPLIMHLVYRETRERAGAGAGWGLPLGVMYVVSPLAGTYLIGGIFELWPRPANFGRVIGTTFGVLFTCASVYSAALMVTRRQPTRTTDERRLGNAMLLLFFLVTMIFVAVAVFNDRRLLVAVFDRVSRTTPLFFLVVAVYFENRFEFYDMVVKRGVMLVATLLALGLMFVLADPLLDVLPAGGLRPWLAAVALLPVALALPWLSRVLSASLDRLWFGRQFTAVEAVRHLLGAMQPATDEPTLIVEAERRLAQIAGAPIAIGVDTDAATEAGCVTVEGATPSGGRIRFAVAPSPTARRLLSEDLLMLRSLANVFGFMLETIRLQQKRREQELVAQELRLQTSRSELKALRAQINPHFLFNALNAIASLIHTDPARADEAVEQLAEVFRYTLRRSDSEWAPLDQELAFARAYLDVEQARFGQRLTYAVDAEDLSPAPQIPSMLLQTLIENAVKHGVSQTRGPGRIEVAVRAAGQQLLVEVRDNGPGPGAATRTVPGGEGFGLRSVRERLAGHFGARAGLSLTRDEATGMTVARITMPIARVAA